MKYFNYFLLFICLSFSMTLHALRVEIEPPLEKQIKVIQKSDGTLDQILIKQENGEWQFFCKASKPIVGVGIGYINPNVVYCSVVYIIDNNNFPDRDFVYFNMKTNEMSPLYVESVIFNDPKLLVLEPDVNKMRPDYTPVAVILHPIFKSQPNVRMVIARDFGGFPSLGGTTKFEDNGDLFLVIAMVGSQQDVIEDIIPIHYSKFQQKTDKPICWAIPSEHTFRPCNATERAFKTASGWGGD